MFVIGAHVHHLGATSGPDAGQDTTEDVGLRVNLRFSQAARELFSCRKGRPEAGGAQGSSTVCKS